MAEPALWPPEWRGIHPHRYVTGYVVAVRYFATSVVGHHAWTRWGAERLARRERRRTARRRQEAIESGLPDPGLREVHVLRMKDHPERSN